MKTHTSNQVTTAITEQSKMNSADDGQNKLSAVRREGYWEEKVADAMRRVSQRLPAGKGPARLLGG